jgi:hypothetical protein
VYDVPLLKVPFEEWHCPNGCHCTETIPALPPGATRFHNCPRLHQLSAPLVRVGTDCKVTAKLREDYLGSEVQATGDDDRPYMSVITEHADGHTDLAVNAGLAQGRLGDWAAPEIGPRLWARGSASASARARLLSPFQC